MTNDSINKKMAEIAGYKHYVGDDIPDSAREIHSPPNQEVWFKDSHNFFCNLCGTLPDYCSDLNLVREVELKLVEMGLGQEYITYLHQELGNMWFVNTALANAKERCLAIIKTCTQVEKEETLSKS